MPRFVLRPVGEPISKSYNCGKNADNSLGYLPCSYWPHYLGEDGPGCHWYDRHRFDGVARRDDGNRSLHVR